VLSAAHRDKEALVAWLDLSNSCDPDYLHRCGLDLDRLLIVRPRDAADALAITLHLVESKALAALVFESMPLSGPGLTDLASIDQGILTGTLERLAAAVTLTESVVIFLTHLLAVDHLTCRRNLKFSQLVPRSSSGSQPSLIRSEMSSLTISLASSCVESGTFHRGVSASSFHALDQAAM